MQHKELKDLGKLLQKDGDKVLDATSKLSLPASLLLKLNNTFKSIVPEYMGSCSFHVVPPEESFIDTLIDMQLLYDFIQKTLALKIFPDCGSKISNQLIDLGLFRNLKLLEIQRYSVNLVQGLKNLRSQLEFVTCRTSLTNLREVFEDCGADNAQGQVWGVLKQAVFSHNHLHALDESLEFAPSLKHLDLSYNLIQNVDNLNYLSNLKYLNLANNRVEVLPKFSGQLRNNLQILILNNNFIESINELEELTNLQDLDLGNNILLELDNLKSLNCLCKLMKLRLLGNPIYYHPDYRVKVCRALHAQTSPFCFKLDGRKLSSKEVRVLGTLQPVTHRFERTESFNSTYTASTTRPPTVVEVDLANSFQSANTVINLQSKNLLDKAKTRVEQTSDMEVSDISLETRTVDNPERRFVPTLDVGMHDSGFEAGPQRPISRSESIGSAVSLQYDDRPRTMRKKFSESDIEILSNPSQSSIEVLCSNHTPM